MYVQTRTLRSLNGLGDVCAVLTNGARICSPTPTPTVPKAVLTTITTPPVAPVLATGVVPTLAPTTTPAAVNDPNCLAAGMLGGPYPNCTPNPYALAAAPQTSSGVTSMLTGTTILGFPLWMWLAGGVGFYLLFLRRK